MFWPLSLGTPPSLEALLFATFLSQ
jgi:hypothetical protein